MRVWCKPLPALEDSRRPCHPKKSFCGLKKRHSGQSPVASKVPITSELVVKKETMLCQAAPGAFGVARMAYLTSEMNDVDMKFKPVIGIRMGDVNLRRLIRAVFRPDDAKPSTDAENMGIDGECRFAG